MAGTSSADLALEALRGEGDPLADDVIRELFTHAGLGAVQGLMGHLVANDAPVPSLLPQVVRRYLEVSTETVRRELPHALVGEQFFALHGPEIFLALCCSSLPFDYANARAVQVLYQTGFLAKRPNLRVAQTAQMLVDVLTPGGLSPEGRGIRSAQKVRLMHAAVRRMILEQGPSGWNVEELGVPINQQDLLYTLVSFTRVVLLGLERLRIDVSTDQAQAYLDVWCVVGECMGIRPELLPRTLRDLTDLAERLARLGQAESHAGKVMTDAISGLVGEVLGPLGCFRWSLIRFFVGPELARLLGIRRRPLRDCVVGVVAWFASLLDRWAERSAGHRRVFRWLSLNLIQHFIDAQLGGPNREFRIPTELHQGWRASGSSTS